MGFLDWLVSPTNKEHTEKRELLRPDRMTKVYLDEHINRSFGTPYVTQEERAKLAKEALEARERQRKRTEEEAKAKKPKNSADNNAPAILSPDSDVRYSLSSDDDREALSRQADSFFLFSDRPIGSRYLRDNPMLEVMSFIDCLRLYINASGMDNVEIYKKANLSKAVFSSLFTKGHIPKKGTIIALAIALKLDLKETERLLMKAGYTFSNSIKGDLIAVYFINHGIYDIDRLNGALYEYGQPILGSKSY